MPLTLDELERRAYITNDQATLAGIEAGRDAWDDHERFIAGYRAFQKMALAQIRGSKSVVEALQKVAVL